jgi:hypothetical protein
MFYLIRKCNECDKVISRKEISEQTFIEMRDRAWSVIDRMGEEDHSPVITDTEFVSYNALCAECEENDDYTDFWKE